MKPFLRVKREDFVKLPLELAQADALKLCQLPCMVSGLRRMSDPALDSLKLPTRTFGAVAPTPLALMATWADGSNGASRVLIADLKV